jgi:diphthamide biosynthesis methyltransferase
MEVLEFIGEYTLDDIKTNYRLVLHEYIFLSIRESYKNTSINEVKFVVIRINNKEYILKLARENFTLALAYAINDFETLEEYGKCQTWYELMIEILSSEKEDVEI